MKSKQASPETIDEYIAGYPENVQKILEEVRATIRKAAPQAKETISYKIPTFTLNGHYLIYFAGYKNHISLYPAPMGVDEFKDELAKYGAGKGTLKFPLDKPVPVGVIRKLVKYRIKENLAREATRQKKR